MRLGSTLHVRLASLRRFQRGLHEITAAIAGHGNDAVMLARDIIALEEKLTTEEEEAAEEEAEEAEEAQEALDAKRAWLAKAEKDIDALEVFYKEVCDQ